jgi:hypothetical protein
LWASVADAADDFPRKERHRWVGMQLDFGVPDGFAAGLVIRPYFNWIRLTASGTYGLAEGYRGGVTLDPINFPIGLTATFEAGHTSYGRIPSFSAVPAFNYDYMNLHLGLEIGMRNHWRLFVRGGSTWVKAQTKGFEQTVEAEGATVAEPTVTARIVPTAKVGIATYF